MYNWTIAKEVKAEQAFARKQRAQEVFDRKNSNPFGYKFLGLKDTNNDQQ